MCFCSCDTVYQFNNNQSGWPDVPVAAWGHILKRHSGEKLNPSSANMPSLSDPAHGATSIISLDDHQLSLWLCGGTFWVPSQSAYSWILTSKYTSLKNHSDLAVLEPRKGDEPQTTVNNISWSMFGQLLLGPACPSFHEDVISKVQTDWDANWSRCIIGSQMWRWGKR